MPGHAPIWLLLGILLIYVISGIVIGLRVQDYHVLGFVGSINGFLANPFGRGIGAGGSVGTASIDWSLAQHVGSTDIATESAIGVLLYQMGVAGMLIVAVLVWLSLKLWHFYLRFGDRLAAAMAFALLIMTANGIFQEEALFAPLALGFVAALAGLVLGRCYRLSLTTPGGPCSRLRLNWAVDKPSFPSPADLQRARGAGVKPYRLTKVTFAKSERLNQIKLNFGLIRLGYDTRSTLPDPRR